MLGDPEAAYSAILSVAPSSTIPRDAFIAAAAKEIAKSAIEVAHRLSDEDGQALCKRVPGVQVLRERWRQYPGGKLARTIHRASSHTARMIRVPVGPALKRCMRARSRVRAIRSIGIFAELFSGMSNLLVNAKDAREGDIITTIEPEVQTRLAGDLAKLNQRYSSKESGGIIMDPATGAIIAIAGYPTYDGNNLQSVDPTLLGNSFVEHVYEFGSIMKPITMTAALDAGVITPATTYDDTGCITVNTARICNWDAKARGVIPMRQIIMQSLNVGSSWIADQLGQDAFREYFTKLFAEKTGVDLPNETGALLRNLFKPQQVGYSTAAFGQGIAVTPMQMIRALGALANGGTMVQPHLVRAIRLNSGIERTLDWGKKTPIFSATSTRETVEMMSALNDEILYGGKAKIPTMSVAAKTGTAQLTSPGGGLLY